LHFNHLLPQWSKTYIKRQMKQTTIVIKLVQYTCDMSTGGRMFLWSRRWQSRSVMVVAAPQTTVVPMAAACYLAIRVIRWRRWMMSWWHASIKWHCRLNTQQNQFTSTENAFCITLNLDVRTYKAEQFWLILFLTVPTTNFISHTQVTKIIVFNHLKLLSNGCFLTNITCALKASQQCDCKHTRLQNMITILNADHATKLTE